MNASLYVCTTMFFDNYIKIDKFINLSCVHVMFLYIVIESFYNKSFFFFLQSMTKYTSICFRYDFTKEKSEQNDVLLNNYIQGKSVTSLKNRISCK